MHERRRVLGGRRVRIAHNESEKIFKGLGANKNGIELEQAGSGRGDSGIVAQDARWLVLVSCPISPGEEEADSDLFFLSRKKSGLPDCEMAGWDDIDRADE